MLYFYCQEDAVFSLSKIRPCKKRHLLKYRDLFYAQDEHLVSREEIYAGVHFFHYNEWVSSYNTQEEELHLCLGTNMETE